MIKKSVKSWGLLVNGRLTPFADRDRSEIKKLEWDEDYVGRETKTVRVIITRSPSKKTKRS